MAQKIETPESFARILYDLNKSDRYSFTGIGGFPGEGKSVLLIHIQKGYSKIAGLPWTFKDNMTWDRDELMSWIDGDKKGKGRKPEYSAIDADELISMFFKRNWFEDKQKGGIEILNKCRDRHLLVGGNVPNFWDLDGSIQSLIRFYIYCPRGRGIAWVFEQEDNPFSKDPWNVSENLKAFRKNGNPYKCANYVCTIKFPDLNPEEKKEYYAIRNTKRKNTENQNKKEKFEKYGKIKKQRDIMVREIFKLNPNLTNVDVADMLENSISKEAIRLIRAGEI